MIILIGGCSHTGKTALAQKLLEKYKIPYFSIDHLKMGLIRSGNTALTPSDDDSELTAYLWPIIREMIHTAIENNQNLIIEGCYIPFDWKNDFDEAYLEQIRYCCLIMTKEYIESHLSDIHEYASVIEARADDDRSYWSQERLIEENTKNLMLCKKHQCEYVLIDSYYEVDIEL